MRVGLVPVAERRNSGVVKSPWPGSPQPGGEGRRSTWPREARTKSGTGPPWPTALGEQGGPREPPPSYTWKAAPAGNPPGARTGAAAGIPESRASRKAKE